MMNDDNTYKGSWPEYHNAHRDEFDDLEECMAAFNRAFDAHNFIPPMFANGESCPCGANDKWVEKLTVADLTTHYQDVRFLKLNCALVTSKKMLKRFDRTFGETK